MLLSEIKSILNADVLSGEDDAALNEKDIHTACGCDLMSDVLAFVKDQSLLLTGLINSQVIRTAEMMDIVAICFVRGKTPTEDVIELAREKGITLMHTSYPLYLACGKLYEKGLGGRCDA
ncbi:MAG: DRTGG domain-containing protein [Clostridiales bacterium]|nr:DRTGG domain-containing protein [Clostridiales bacterium]